jgi:hypothetical protein
MKGRGELLLDEDEALFVIVRVKRVGKSNLNLHFCEKRIGGVRSCSDIRLFCCGEKLFCAVETRVHDGGRGRGFQHVRSKADE